MIWWKIWKGEDKKEENARQKGRKMKEKEKIRSKRVKSMQNGKK
jgi:hypothetical protein